MASTFAPMTPSARLVLLTDSLLWAIAKASSPEALAPEYRPATRDAVKFARQACREVIAIEGRAELQKLLCRQALINRTRTIAQPDPYVPSAYSREWRGR